MYSPSVRETAPNSQWSHTKRLEK